MLSRLPLFNIVRSHRSKNQAFTIVELLIVIVIIAILASITIIAFNGTQQRAIQASLQADTDKARKKILLYHAENSTYPTAINCTNPTATEVCVQPSGTNTYRYTANNSTNPPKFYLDTSNGKYSYQTTESMQPQTVPSVVTDGLVLNLDAGNTASYPGTGTTWYDLSGNGNNGTLSNGPVYSSQNGGSIQLDGVNDNILLGDVIDLGTNSMTINVWFNYSNNTGSNTLFSKSFYGGQDYRYSFTLSNGYLAAFMQGNGGADVIPKGVTALNPSTWYMGTAVYRRSSNIDCYINGVTEPLTGSRSISSWNNLDFQSINPARVGSYTFSDNISPNYPFVGKIAAVQIYFRELTPSEITQNFNALRGRYGI